jgi:glycosyltransferase involved in cell wall biosynthesis
MRITLVNYAYADDVSDPAALLERYSTLTGWSEAVAAAGSSVSVVQRFCRDQRLARNGIEYVFCRDGQRGHPRTRRWPRRVHRAVLAQRPDVVHVNDLQTSMQTWLLRRALPSSVAVVVQDHGGGGPAARYGAARSASVTERLRLAVKRRTMRAADAFFFTAVAQADEWRHYGLIAPEQRVHQVLEASTTLRPVDRVVARQTTGIEGDPAVLWVGRLNANKAPLTVLDGFERSLVHLPNAMLTMIYGADDLLPAVTKRLDASPALNAHVKLVGLAQHDRMASYYSAADLFVLGSHEEGSGYALIEACACGLPPVVTDIPPFRAITDHGSIGALWPPGDALSLARAIVGVAGLDRQTARRRVLDRFDRALSWPVLARTALDAYAGVLAAVRAGQGLV